MFMDDQTPFQQASGSSGQAMGGSSAFLEDNSSGFFGSLRNPPDFNPGVSFRSVGVQFFFYSYN